MMQNDRTPLLDRYHTVKDRIDQAARASGRDSKAVRLIAVSKLHPAESIRTLAQAGHRDFGESYIQEALRKQEALEELAISWHFIGSLQTNKAKFVPGRFHLIHSVGSPRLARALHSRARSCSVRQKILIQINLAEEPQKAGIAEKECVPFVEQVLDLDGLDLKGLMVMPPLNAQKERARPYFSRLRQIRDELEGKFAVSLPELSMGMSGDFVQAVEEGATLVRIGTEIFGSRPLNT
ncbi:MAG: YggS family pyridoxal phosphate-dependent enzyme [Desulfovibrionales bacterium]